MKNRMATMVAHSLGLSFDTAGAGASGGTAVAEPAAGAGAGAGNASGAGAGAGAGSGGGHAAPPPTKAGFFKDLPRAATRTPEGVVADPKAAAEAAAKAAATKTPPVDAKKPYRVLADDKTTVLGDFATQAEAEAFLKTSAASSGAKTPEALAAEKAATDKEAAANLAAGGGAADALPRPLMGRYATLTEAEAAMRRSQDEGLRLASENKALKDTHAKALADREAEVATLKAELQAHKETPAVKELSKEELAALWKENPSEAAEYVQQKYDRDRSVKAAKERAEREVTERREHLIKTNEAIERNVDEMMKDPKTFPKFQDMLPRMSEILKRTGGDTSPLRGQVWANELAYKAALGDVYQELLLKGTETQADAAEAARLKAENDAAALNVNKGDGGGSGSAKVLDPVAQEDQNWRAAVRASAPKPFLKNRQ